MNFDVNMLSTLMQMLGSNQSKPEPRAPENPKPQSASAFAMENGIGERVDFAPKQDKKPTANPMASLLEMMTGKSSGDGAMGSLMPMLMNMMARPSAVSSVNPSKPASNKNETAERTRNEDSKKYDKNDGFDSDVEAEKDSNTINGANRDSDEYENKNAENRQSNPAKSNSHASGDIYAPITFAGYPLISCLNKLYRVKRAEALRIR